MIDRRALLASLLLVTCALGCGGGANSRLITVRAATGSGPVEFEVKNACDVAVNSLFFAKTAQVTQEVKFDSIQGSKIWGGDMLNKAIPVGTRVKVAVPEPGVWDVRATDKDGRYQHVTALKLSAGGRFILELNEGGWRVEGP